MERIDLIRALIFDLDGVILDSNRAIFDTYREVARKMGRRVPETDEIRGLLGQPSALNLKHLFGDDRRARPYYDEILKRTHANLPFLPHAREVLEEIKLPKAIVTSKRREHAEKSLGELLQYFKIMVTPEDTPKPKPYPEPLLMGCERLKVRPEAAVYVGDTVRDFQTAENAGTEFVGFVHEGSTREEFLIAGADRIITSLRELPFVIGDM